MKKTAFLPSLLVLALLALPAAAANDGHAVYRPGLTQARIPLGSPMGYVTAYTGVPALASNLLATADASWLDRTLDVFKDGEHANDATNPVSGKTWPWLVENRHGVFAYEGEIFVEQGTEYYFYGRFWTGEALVVDGTTAVWQGPHNGYNYPPDVYGAWTAPKTGWVPFNAWEWTCEESHSPQWATWGLEYNLSGLAVEGEDQPDKRQLAQNSYTNVWLRFADPGNGSFLRTRTDERFLTIGASEPVASGRSFSLSFADVPTNAQLVACTGPVDGVHDTNGWANVSAVLADVAPGDSTTTVSVPLPAGANVLRFRLAHVDAASTNGLDVFEEWSEMVAVSAAPAVRLVSVSPGYTNVVAAGVIDSLGIGGASAVVEVEVAAAGDAAFGTILASTNLPAAAAGGFSAEILGLATNTAYLVRARATNDQVKQGTSPTVPFSTKEPGPAAVSVAATVCALFSADLTATVSDWGGGSWDARDAWIDVSADDSFPAGATQTLPLGALSGAAPVSATATATGLEMNHAYFARARAVNSWGVESVSETVSFSTSDKPIGFPREATVTAGKGRVSASLAPTFVTEGTVYGVTLSLEGVAGGRSWPNQTGYGPFEHHQSTAAGTTVVFVYTIDWTYGEQSGTIEVRGSAKAKLADRTIESVPEIDPAIGGAYLRPGDTVEIIPTAGTRVDWHTNAVLSITPTNGVFLLEALEPGAALLYETDLATDKTNNVTGAAIVLPEGNPPGGVYVHRALRDWSWTDPSEWEMVSPGPKGYPDAAGSWAIVASDALGPNDSEKKIDITVPVTVGHIAVGQLGYIHHGVPKNLKSHWEWIFSDDLGLGGSIRFDTGDGSASGLRLLGHSYTTSRVLFQVPVTMANDLEVDELNRVQDTLGWQNTRFRGLWFMKPVDIGPHTFRTVRANPYPYRFTATWSGGSHAGGVESAGWLSFRNNVLGSGTIRLEAATHVGLLGADGAHVSPFTGVWDVANGDLDPHLNSAYGGAALNTWGLSLGQSREMIVRGSWHRAEKTWPRGALVRTGFNNVRTSESTGNGCTGHAWTNDWQDALPPKITLDGGDLQIQPQGPMNSAAQAAANATSIRRNLFRIGELAVPAGPMGRMDFRNRNNSTGYAHARTEVTNLVLEPGAVLSFDLDKDQPNVTHEFYLVGEPDGAWAPPGGAGAQLLPFLFANNQMEATGSGGTPAESSVGEQDNTRLAFRDAQTGKVTLGEPAAEGNGYRRWTAGETLADGAKYYSMQLAKDVGVSFAPGATVQNLAGYVDMRKGAALGRPGEDAGATLDFGDRPARIFNGNWGEVGTIGCRLSGSAGLVTGGNGTIALGASAEGVAGGVRVAGGTLRLFATVDGTNHVGRIGGDIAVEAGSRLVVGDRSSIVPGSKLFLNDRDWIPSVGHVRLEAGVRAVVREILVAGEPLPHGWYGSSDSAAKHVDDVHFEGPGMIHAGSFPTMMILK